MNLEQQIRAAYEKEDQDKPIARVEGDIPVSFDAISDEWLTAVLCRDAPGVSVRSHRLGERDDGTNNRRRIYLDYEGGDAAANMPESVFCKATHDLNNRLILGHSGAVLGEVVFFNNARPLLDIEAPRALHAAYDPVSFNSIVVMEDLGEGVRFFEPDAVMSRDMAEGQVDLLAGLHGPFLHDLNVDQVLAELPDWHRRFSNLIGFHLEDACAQGFAAAKSVMPASIFARAGEIWPKTLASLERQRALPRTLCHGDTHLKNWYRTGSGRIGLGDWGVAHRGHWSRDLAYAITTGLGTDDRRRWERELVARYLDAMDKQGLSGVDVSQAMRWMAESLLTVLAFWTMTLKPNPDWPDMQPPEASLIFIGRITRAMEDHGSLDLF